MPACRIVLVGMMGSGKTTVGRLLAEATGWPRHDNDELLHALYGMSPRQLLAERGEVELRAAEEAALMHGLRLPAPAIVTAAAGTIASNAVRRALATQVVAWLDAPADDLYRRARTAAHRPWLKGGAEWFRSAASERSALFASVADLRLDTSRLTARQAADEVLRSLDVLCASRA